MPLAFSLALLIFGGVLAYHCAVYAHARIDVARQQRVKKHLDWTVDRRRERDKGGWRFW